MNRRDLLRTTFAAGVAGLVRPAAALASTAIPSDSRSPATAPAARPAAAPAAKAHVFRLKYAPHFGLFEAHAGKDLVDQLRFGADQGFTAWEDNGMAERPVADQERIAREMDRLGMTMGVFVAMADFQNVTFASPKPENRQPILARAKAAIDVAKRVNARWTTVVPGRYDVGLEWDYQTAHVIDNLKRCAELLEPAGLVMVLEPLNPWKDHPGLFLSRIPQAFQVCRAVASPSCKILFDMYHQQISEGNIIPNIERAWDEVAYFQMGDNPGRKEPGTGEMNYRNIFARIHAKGYAGVLGMEHGMSRPGREGEAALIAAYRDCDSF